MRANHCIFVVSFAIGSTVIGGSAEARQGRGTAPTAPSGTVTLTVADYDRLLDRAAQPIAPPDRPPVPAIVGAAELRARVDNGQVRGTLRLEGEIFQRGAVKVPLVSGATLLEAKAGARPLPLLQDGRTHSAVFDGPAPFSAVLEWAGLLETVPGRASLTLPHPASASVTVIVDLPGDPADVRVAPGILTRRQTAAGRTLVEIAPDRQHPARISWSARESAPQPAAAPAVFLADLRSLLTIGDANVRMTSLVDVTVVRGEPRTFQVEIPEQYEVADVTGSSVEASDTQNRTVNITVRDAARRRHQFLIRLERPNDAGSFALATSFPSLRGAQRQAGEAAIEGMGTMEVSASGDQGLRRMDVREANAGLRALARQPILAAFRYQRRQEDPPVMTLDVKRFADAPVIAAAIEHAVATTLVTSEGRMLTEVSLRIRNTAQPFMKVTLPDGATMLSVEVAGEPARPVEGGGVRIPLLRPGFRPDGAYPVSFVYHHAAAPFAKRGDAQLSLARVDVPVNLLEWELFLPEQFPAKPVAGNVIPARFVQSAPPRRRSEAIVNFGESPRPGLLTGRVVDALGGAIPGATVSMSVEGRTIQRAVTDANGAYTLRGVQPGTITVTCEMQGFMSAGESVAFTGAPPRIDFRMQVAPLVEMVTVTAESVGAGTGQRGGLAGGRAPSMPGEADEGVQQAPPQNIVNLQRRVAGVLPVRIDVPRAGNLYRFYRPLVLDERTEVTLRYRRR